MAAYCTQTSVCRIPSLHNFRSICLNDIEPSSTQRLSVFRSSRPDFLTEDEIDEFKSLGIKCIIDLRSESDYQKADGKKLLQACGLFETQVVQLPSGRGYKANEKVECSAPKDNILNDDNLRTEERNDTPKKHYLVNFFTSAYVKTILKRAPWYIKLISIFVLIFDFIFKTGYNNFVRLYAKSVINPAGLVASYIDIIEMSKNSICAALKLLCDRENIPALINCAHGKDRTGIVSAMVLAVLGESKENIAADYHRSEAGLEPVRQRLYDEVVKKYSWDVSFTGAVPETMDALLNYINEKYGSVANYLESIGFSRQEQEQLRINLGYTEQTTAN